MIIYMSIYYYIYISNIKVLALLCVIFVTDRHDMILWYFEIFNYFAQILIKNTRIKIKMVEMTKKK